MTPKTTIPQTPRSTPADEPRRDKKRDMPDAIIEEPGETRDSGRDLAHGEGGSISVPEKPGDLSKDD
ncbi:hypothetical protein [Bradyrhizobium sp. 199]|uniref:hypothetical protein n=1 Tax=Bradyrhizobium sp. 199 TaxID=2782664 RepID=UPI001FF830E6|nr:hypothetical protein [Bradyrhizobium sp. 199]MCK1358940.1 hypothetical protein [Bradyrhizobium sp. 199]